jgi:RNA polymerase sigma-70 factor (ECF subfamily)
MDMKPDQPLTQQSDQDLIRLYRAGREEAFAVLVHRYERELFFFLLRFVGDRAPAEDVFQDTCLQVHLSIESFDLQRPFKPWLFTISANKARDYLRRTKQRQTVRLTGGGDDEGEGGQIIDLIDSQFPTPDEHADSAETRQFVRETIADLPPNMKEILLMAYFHHVPYKDIAQNLGIPLGTVKSRLHAAVATFAEHWKRRFNASPNPAGPQSPAGPDSASD